MNRAYYETMEGRIDRMYPVSAFDWPASITAQSDRPNDEGTSDHPETGEACETDRPRTEPRQGQGKHNGSATWTLGRMHRATKTTFQSVSRM